MLPVMRLSLMTSSALGLLVVLGCSSGSSGDGASGGSAGTNSGGSGGIPNGGTGGVGVAGTIGCSAKEHPGQPDLTSSPSISDATASPGSTVTVSVPVDAETGYVSVNLSNANPSTPGLAGATNVATPGSETVSVVISVLGIAEPGTYFPIVNLCSSEQACLVDLVGVSYTRAATVSEPYNRVEYAGTDVTGTSPTCFGIPTLDIQ
jgi:hypothetical protein